MDVADDIERAMVVAPIDPELCARDRDRVHRLGRAQHVHIAQSLAFEPAQSAPQVVHLAADHEAIELAIGTRAVALGRQRLRQVKDDAHRERVARLGERDQRASRFGLHIGRVHHRKSPVLEACVDDRVDERERVRRDRLVVLVVRDPPSRAVRGDDLGGREMPRGEGGLARARRADEQHEREVGDVDQHRVNTPIWVGAPYASCAGPMPSNATV